MGVHSNLGIRSRDRRAIQTFRCLDRSLGPRGTARHDKSGFSGVFGHHKVVNKPIAVQMMGELSNTGIFGIAKEVTVGQVRQIQSNAAFKVRFRSGMEWRLPKIWPGWQRGAGWMNERRYVVFSDMRRRAATINNDKLDLYARIHPKLASKPHMLDTNLGAMGRNKFFPRETSLIGSNKKLLFSGLAGIPRLYPQTNSGDRQDQCEKRYRVINHPDKPILNRTDARYAALVLFVLSLLSFMGTYWFWIGDRLLWLGRLFFCFGFVCLWLIYVGRGDWL